MDKLKYRLCMLLFIFVALNVHAQTNDSKAKLGFALNSSMNGEVYPIRLVPSVTYLKGNSQLELGFGIHPFIRKDQRIYSGEFNYKYFPNGITKKFNMYLLASLSYINNPRKTYYPTTYNYIFLNGGYGFEIRSSERIYIGTNISAGAYTYGIQSENPYPGSKKKDLFNEFGFNLAFQFNIGFRL